jgi:colanic acid/amylovoran biosynthesis glycosyltransferase
MKVALILSYFPALSETFILNQVTGLLDMGHEVEIFSSQNPNEKKIHPDVEDYRLLQRTHFMPHNKVNRVLKAAYLINQNFYKSPLKLLKSLNIFKYGVDALSLKLLYALIPLLEKTFDIIHCHFGPNGILGEYLKTIGIRGKYITSFHGYDVNFYAKMVGANVYEELFEKGEVFICSTNFVKDRLVDLGCNAKKIVILPVGIPIGRFKFCERTIQEKEPIKVVTVARLVEEKGHRYAIEAISELVRKHMDLQYIIAGDGPLRRDLDNLVSKLGLGRHVRFLGAVDQNEVLELYRQAHIFILPSVIGRNGGTEGQGLALQEAQAVGLPIISTSIGGIPEGVLDGKSGFLVQERDVDALTERLQYLIAHPELWPEMGRCGRKFVEEKYDIKMLNSKLVRIYDALLTDNTALLDELCGLQ